MTSARILRPALLGAAALAIALLTGCAPETAGAASSPPPSASPAPSVESRIPSTSASDGTTDATTEVTCESLLTDEMRDVFESSGWTYQEGSFMLGDLTLDDGIWCQWGDFTVANDHVQIYAWAPITGSQADDAIDELVAQGWVREDSPGGVYITEDTSFAVAVDGDGYGMTFLFGDGWVTVSDTKQGLLLIQRP